MARGARTLRLAVLLTAAALGLHQLRYLIAFGDGSDAALAGDGHAYLSLLAVPALGLGLGAVLAHALLRIARGGHSGAAPCAVRLWRVWPAASAALLGIYAGQELLEGALAPGHPAGLAAVVGGGGWVAVPLALALAALVALALRIASAADAPRGGHGLSLHLKVRPVLGWMPVACAYRRGSGRELAEHLAGRGPPAACR